MKERLIGSRISLFWACAGGMFMFGIVLAILGALFGLPETRERLGINLAQQGDVFLLLFFGVFLSTVLSGPAIDSFGNKAVLAISSLFMTTGLILLALAQSYLPALAGSLVLGFGGGGVNTSTNALVSDLFPEKRGAMLNLLGVFFGFGALFIPLLAAAIVGVLGPVQLLWIASGLSAVCLASFAILRFPAPREQVGFSPLGVLKVARHPGILLLAVMLFFQSGNESSIGGWVSTYLGSTGASPRAATWVLAGYWAALMAGRVLSAKLLETMTKPSLVFASAIGSTAGALVLLVSTSTPALAAGTLLIGLSYAAIYPTTLAIAGDSTTGEAGSIFGFLFAVGLVGGMIFPWVLGKISQGWSVRLGMTLPLIGALAITALISVVAARTRRVET